MLKNPLWYFLLALILLLGCSHIHDDVHSMAVGQNNAIWTESIYLRGYQPSTHVSLTVEQIKTYANNLKAHHINILTSSPVPMETTGICQTIHF